jgi:hypothetical protein
MRPLVLLAVAACTQLSVTPPANMHGGGTASAQPIFEDLARVRLAMSQPELLAVRPNAKRDGGGAAFSSFRTEIDEDVHDGTLVQVTYYLSNRRRLYEVIVEYADAERARAAFRRIANLSGAAPKDGDDIVLRGFPYPVHAWAFDAKVVVAAAFDDDEWVEMWK